jgi:hypothetical protein
MARLPNKGVALKHDLAERSARNVSSLEYQILPKCDPEIFWSNLIRIVWRRPESNREITESNVKKTLQRDVTLREESMGVIRTSKWAEMSNSRASTLAIANATMRFRGSFSPSTNAM